MSNVSKHRILVQKRLREKIVEIPLSKVSRIVEDYPREVLAEVTDSQHKELEREGYIVKDLRSKTKIRIGTRTIDPLKAEEREEVVGPADEEEALVAETEYFFVQFEGSIKPEWLEDLNKAKLIPLSYYHDYTYLVNGKASAVNKFSKYPFVLV
ncbi:unnamed protein product [marine sediment metagenome]|uniref:Uncharacterized protein n=1 Tax=marine sediment metagenome TaxID=412755 RepID=X1A648_9ZZZZ